METKAAIDKNVSIVHEAQIKNADGVMVSAKEVLCAEAPAVILGLEAAQALTKNPWVKFVIGMVINMVQTLIMAFCTETEVK